MTMAMGAGPYDDELVVRPAAERQASERNYLMCPPFHFAVSYAINPWMRPDQPADARRAVRQWERLRQVYTELGHTVHLIEPVPGLPDMVFAANGATVVGGGCWAPGSATRSGRPRPGPTWTGSAATATPTCERPAGQRGRRRHPVPGSALLAGYGFRSDPGAAAELEAAFGLPVHPVRLVDPRFYHLDTAMCVLDADTAAYYPAAFDDAGRATLAGLFGQLIEATDADAAVLGLNAVSDGRHVVLPEQASDLAAQADRARVRADRRGPVRAAQGGRRPQVLHTRAT